MPCGDKLPNNSGTDKARSACDENTHFLSSLSFRLLMGSVFASLIATVKRSDAAVTAREATSPGERAVIVRERARRTARRKQRESHWFAGALCDRARACIVVQVRLGVALAGGVDLDPRWLQLDRHGDRHSVQSRLGCSVAGAEDRAVGVARIRVPGQRTNGARHVDDARCLRLA